MAKLTCPIRQHAQQHPTQPALWNAGVTFNYQQLDARLNALQQQLRRAGLKSGDHLFLCSPNSAELVMLLWACWREQIVCCPINPAFPKARQLQLQQQVHASVRWPSDELELDFTAQAPARKQRNRMASPPTWYSGSDNNQPSWAVMGTMLPCALAK